MYFTLSHFLPLSTWARVVGGGAYIIGRYGTVDSKSGCFDSVPISAIPISEYLLNRTEVRHLQT
jgi:hypothetical protein